MNEINDKKWLNEPNEHSFEYKGYQCKMLRNKMGTWCGYIGIPINHKYANKDKAISLEVHGGVTFTSDDYEFQDGLYWIGFDCSHLDDIMPTISVFEEVAQLIDSVNSILEYKFLPRTYKDIDFVINQLKNLADQLEIS